MEQNQGVQPTYRYMSETIWDHSHTQSTKWQQNSETIEPHAGHRGMNKISRQKQNSLDQMKHPTDHKVVS